MNQRFFLVFFTLVFLISFISADVSIGCSLDINLINQEPYPASPGEYVKVVFQVNGVENPDCQNVEFEVLPSYPFTLKEGQVSVKTLKSSTYVYEYKNDWMIPFTFLVNEAALSGDMELKVQYNFQKAGAISSSHIMETFVIPIEDSRTDFDAVVQDISGTDISIAIANVGKYTANSVIVKVPEQEGVKAIGTNGQMVGNLENGDYTIVSFSISQRPTQGGSLQRTEGEKTSSPEKTKLTIQIDYTDAIGERRTKEMEVEFDFESFMTMSEGANPLASKMGARQQSSAWYKNWVFWIVLIVVLIVGFFLWGKYKIRILEFIQRKKDLRKKKENVPDWVIETKKSSRSKK